MNKVKHFFAEFALLAMVAVGTMFITNGIISHADPAESNNVKSATVSIDPTTLVASITPFTNSTDFVSSGWYTYNENNKFDSADIKKLAYAFNDLWDRCKTAITGYNTMIGNYQAVKTRYETCQTNITQLQTTVAALQSGVDNLP